TKISDHRVMSPLKNDMKACITCHSQGENWLRERVYQIQDRTVSRLIRSGYAAAEAAKLFELANEAGAAGKRIDKALYAEARENYEQALYRVIFIGAENSTGFHHPDEVLRVLGDAGSYARKAEGLLRQALAKAGVNAPAKTDLELRKYLENRGEKNLGFDRSMEFEDPYARE
ncbi:MAG: ammonia-forming cytochrome c nitrite reductase subunit c552, partial [Elusimicrobiales bacterium]|nr:ammonia-forming cytochrome c nitrite reductase subunit c552 [Elusimicrobiales bacterium]